MLCLLSAGCGWNRGMLLPGTARTVGVEIFRTDRRVYERGLETALHRELTRAVSDLVQAPLVRPEDADLVLRGSIAGYRRRTGIRNQDNRLLETGVLIEIKAELITRRALIAAARAEAEAAEAAEAGGTATPAAVENGSRAQDVRVWSGHALDNVGNEGAARNRALRYLAETIVLELFSEAPQEDEQSPE